LGGLQSNKVKDIVGKVHLIHSLDSWHYGRRNQQKSAKYANRGISIAAGKYFRGNTEGRVEPDEVADILASLGQLPALAAVRLYDHGTAFLCRRRKPGHFH
jgi:uncharacterized pyridoxal phosphate-containing UPF0001 family protein